MAIYDVEKRLIASYGVGDLKTGRFIVREERLSQQGKERFRAKK